MRTIANLCTNSSCKSFVSLKSFVWLLPAVTLCFAPPAVAFRLSTNTDISTLGSSADQSVIPGSRAFSNFLDPSWADETTANVIATASADFDLTLQTLAKSNGASGYSLVQVATASAGTGLVNYTVFGNPLGLVLPLTFNYRITGRLQVVPNNGVATVGFRYGIGSSGGGATGSASASFSSGGRLTIANGFLGPNIATGIDTLGQDTLFDFVVPINITSSQNRGIITTNLVSSAAASSGAFGLSDFSSGLVLESVTIPQSFSGAGLGQLNVLFGTGYSVPVTVVGSSNPGSESSNPAKVPEFTSVISLIAVGLGILTMKRKFVSSVQQ